MVRRPMLANICFGLLLCALPNAGTQRAHAEDANEMLAYIGTYTGNASRGIYVSRFNPATGQLGAAVLAAETANPSFLAIHPSGRFLYAVGELSETNGKKGGAVTAWAIDPKTGLLKAINDQSSKGAGPCHLVVDKAGKHVLVANYGGGSVASLPIGPDGRLGPASSFIQHEGSSVNRQRQSGPHAHSINLDSQNRFAVVADLGLDKLLVYRFEPASGRLSPAEVAFTKVAPGAGPRHFAFHPTGKFAYVINEIDLTVTAFAYDAQRGLLSTLQSISTIPDWKGDRVGFSTAEVVVHPTGKFLYGSNRGHDSIAVFAIDADSGKLTHVENESTQGKTPRNFAIDPGGAYLLAENQSSGTIVVFRIDQETGALAATGDKLQVPSPVCVRFLVSGDRK